MSQMRRRIEKYRKAPPSHQDYSIGCIVIGAPFFFAPEEWIPIPGDWSPKIVSGKSYDLLRSPGRELRDAVQVRPAAREARRPADRAAKHVVEMPVQRSTAIRSRYFPVSGRDRSVCWSWTRTSAAAR